MHELIFVNAYGIIVITVIINHFGNIYITIAVSLCGSNGVGINNIFQLISYPATGCYIFYNCIYALTIGIINL